MYATKLNKSQEALMQSSHDLNQMTIASIKKISDIHAHAIRGMAENMQRRMVELCSIKDPLTAPEMLQADEINNFMDQMREYQEELTEASQEIAKEWVSTVGALVEGYKEESGKAFKTAQGNAPDSMDVFTAPFKTAFDAALQSFNETRQSAQNLFNAFEETKNGAAKKMDGSISSRGDKERTAQMGHASGNGRKVRKASVRH